MIHLIYPPELAMVRASSSDTEASFLDFHLTISTGTVNKYIFDRRDDFNVDFVNYPHLIGDVDFHRRVPLSHITQNHLKMFQTL